jgi:hypothetical protein
MCSFSFPVGVVLISGSLGFRNREEIYRAKILFCSETIRLDNKLNFGLSRLFGGEVLLFALAKLFR